MVKAETKVKSAEKGPSYSYGERSRRSSPQAPPRRRAVTDRILVSGLFGSCHHGRFFLAATWGAGQSMMPLSGAPLGTAVQEAAITAVSYSSAPTGIIAFALILWGLRTPSNRAAPDAR